MSQLSTPRPSSPSRSLLDASSTIDDLTRSFVDYSPVSTPEPPLHIPGCKCNTEDSEYTEAWLAVKAKLESRLVLSAGMSPYLHARARPAQADHAQRLDRPCYRDMRRM
jgi:hypothetical protein